MKRTSILRSFCRVIMVDGTASRRISLEGCMYAGFNLDPKP